MPDTVLVVTGCATGGEDDVSPSAEPSAASSPEDEVIAVVEDYWAERIRVEGSGDYASADFEEILGPGLQEAKTALHDSYAEIGHRRVGAPELRDHTATSPRPTLPAERSSRA